MGIHDSPMLRPSPLNTHITSAIQYLVAIQEPSWEISCLWHSCVDPVAVFKGFILLLPIGNCGRCKGRSLPSTCWELESPAEKGFGLDTILLFHYITGGHILTQGAEGSREVQVGNSGSWKGWFLPSACWELVAQVMGYFPCWQPFTESSPVFPLLNCRLQNTTPYPGVTAAVPLTSRSSARKLPCPDGVILPKVENPELLFLLASPSGSSRSH